jgi:hypothetical protein
MDMGAETHVWAMGKPLKETGCFALNDFIGNSNMPTLYRDKNLSSWHKSAIKVPIKYNRSNDFADNRAISFSE